MADNMLIDGLIKFCDEKSKNIKLKAEPQVFIEIREALLQLKVLKSDGFAEDLLNMGYTKGYNKAIDEFAERYKKENVAPKVFERIFRMVQLGESDFSEVAEYINSLYCDLADEVAEQMKAGGKNES